MESLFGIAPLDEHNQSLLNNVHPLDWQNPDPADRYNLVVIGAGSGGLVTAAAAAGLGAKVALVERKLLGGDCLNSGCVPSKGLLRSAHALGAQADWNHLGIHNPNGPAQADFARVMERVRAVRASISPHDSAKRFQELGVDVFFGEGRFTENNTIQVGDQTLRFRKAVIATGSHPLVPPIEGLQEAGYLTNESLFNLTEKPERLLVIGGGPIGCEMAQSFRQLGSEVAVVDMGPRILIKEDEHVSQALANVFRKQGIELILNATFTQVSQENGVKRAHLKTEHGEETREFDQILMAVGRRPSIDSLGLENVGVEADPRTGVKVNDALQTTNPNIYAVGDVCLKYQFTHMADAAARIVIRNTLFSFLPGKQRVSQLIVPWCTYTQPEIAHVGLTQAEAKQKQIAFDVYQRPFAELDRAIAESHEDGFVEIITEQGADRILGATIVAPRAGEMIGEITMAMVNKIGLGQIASVIHPYPTYGEAIRQLGDAVNRKKLTESRKKRLAAIFRWMR